MTVVGSGVVVSVGLAVLTVTSSFSAFVSLSVLLLGSPLYVASHWKKPVTDPTDGTVYPFGVV
jgi:hypothetical protein